MQQNYPNTVSEVLDPSITFKPDTLNALAAFKSSHPWTGSIDEQHSKFKTLHRQLASIYGLVPEPRLIFGNDHVSCSGRSCFIGHPINTIVLRGKLSVLTYLHEFAHARGMNERAACRWSINLFKQVWPRLYARCRHEGHMLRAPARTNS